MPRDRACVPPTVAFREEWRQALTLLGQVRASGFMVAGVLADVEFGDTPRTKCYFANLPAAASLPQVVRLAHQRWAIEQQYQDLKTELGLEDERRTLEQWASRPKTAQRLALRSRMVLACAEGLPNRTGAKRLHVSSNKVAVASPGHVQIIGRPTVRGESARHRRGRISYWKLCWMMTRFLLFHQTQDTILYKTVMWELDFATLVALVALTSAVPDGHRSDPRAF